MPWCTAADPVAHAFSTRVAGLKRRFGSACNTSAAVKSCGEKPALKWPRTISSTSEAPMPASLRASLATLTTRLSTVSVSNLPKGVCAQPTMLAVMVVLLHFFLSGELTTQFVVDVNLDDIVECFLGRREAQFERPLRIEITRPSGDDADDERVRRALDPCGDLIAGHPLERGDLFADGCRNAGHGEVAARTDLCRIQRRGVDEEAHRRARRGMPVPDIFRYRQHGFLSGERLAQDAGEETGRRLVRKARPDADGRQANADPVHEAAARIIGEQKLADGLLGAVAQEWRIEELAADGVRERRAKHSDRRGEDHARLVAAADQPDRIEQHPRAVEVDAVALVEIELGFTRDDRREMENHVGAAGDQFFGDARQCEIAGHGLDRKSSLLRLLWRHHVVARHPRDVACAEPAIPEQPLDQFAPDHTGGAENQNMQNVLLFFLLGSS